MAGLTHQEVGRTIVGRLQEAATVTWTCSSRLDRTQRASAGAKSRGIWGHWPTVRFSVSLQSVGEPEKGTEF